MVFFNTRLKSFLHSVFAKVKLLVNNLFQIFDKNRSLEIGSRFNACFKRSDLIQDLSSCASFRARNELWDPTSIFFLQTAWWKQSWSSLSRCRSLITIRPFNSSSVWLNPNDCGITFCFLGPGGNLCSSILSFSTLTSLSEMWTVCMWCCRGERGTRTEPSWATRPSQWESSTWLR